jgi:hypothetical protein
MPLFIFDVITPSGGDGITTSQAAVAVEKNLGAATQAVKTLSPGCKIRLVGRKPRGFKGAFLVGRDEIVSTCR